jgi:DNA topoisomerase IA
MTRDKALATIHKLPQEFDLDELIERLIFVEKVEKGIDQIREGKTKTHDEVKEIVKKWSK